MLLLIPPIHVEDLLGLYLDSHSFGPQNILYIFEFEAEYLLLNCVSLFGFRLKLHEPIEQVFVLAVVAFPLETPP